MEEAVFFIYGWCVFVLLIATVVPKEKPPINVVGDVHGRIAIIIVSYVT